MSLYRKWRPLGFADLVGQEAVVRTLSHALDTGKLVHAYLFSGPRGSGKTSAAKIMARAITCEHGPSSTPDNTCENCRAILAGTAMDVVEIDAASNRGIDEIRALRDAVKFSPATMRKKVYIVDEAHMLTKEGANAFLKTLEEPPAHVVFILATTAPEALPVTILSRCQRYAFRRIPTGVMVERMRLVAEAEGITVDTDALRTIAQRADGGLRDALTMLEQAASFAEGTVDASVVDAAFGAGGRAFASALIDRFATNDAGGVLRSIDEASAAGVDMANFIRHVIAELRAVLLVRVDPDLLAGELLEDDLTLARERAERLPQVRLLRALRLLAEALAQSRQSGNPRLEIESAMLRLTLQGEDPSLEALAARVKQLEERLAGEGAPSPLPAEPRAKPAPAKTVEPVAKPRPAPAKAVAPVADAEPAAAPEPPVAERATPPPAAKSDALTASPRDAATTVAPSRAATAPPPAPLAAPKEAPRAEKPDFDDRAFASEPTTSAPPKPAAVPPQAPPPAEVAAPGEEPTLARLRSLWPNVRARAEAKSPSLRGPLSRTSPESVDGWTVKLAVADTQNAELLRTRIALIEGALSDVLGGACRATVSVASGTHPRGAKKNDDNPADAALGLLDYAVKRLGVAGD